MRIRTGCRGILQQETAPFCFTEQGERLHICAKAAKEAEREEKREIKTPEGPSFFTQDVVYIVDRPFNLPKLILEGLFGSSLLVCSLWSLHSARIQSGSCIIYECCGCYSDSLIEIVDTSSWNKNNEGTINLSAVNSHLREQHVRFLSRRS